MSITNGAYAVTEEPENWRDNAACAEVPGDIFFPEPGASVRQAKSICASCESRVACLAEAIEKDEQHGVWGGLTRLERRRLKRPGVHAREHIRNVDSRIPWTAEDNQIMREMYEAGHTDSAIANRLGRHSSVIGRRRRTLGLVALFKRGERPA